MVSRNWIEFAKDTETGIETIQAHFEGHAYDPHWHDCYAIGVTLDGVQQMRCRGARHRCTAGKVFLLNPGDIHDGEALTSKGFSVCALHLEPQWLERELCALFEQTPSSGKLDFRATLVNDHLLAAAVADAVMALHSKDIRIVRQSTLDVLLVRIIGHLHRRVRSDRDPRLPLVAQRARDYLHAHMGEEVGLDDLMRVTGVDRFRLTRAFKAAFNMAPHAYLVQLRLVGARHMLANGVSPAHTAAALGFSDQSHLGRWFSRAYRLTPGEYRKRCLNIPDSPTAQQALQRESIERRVPRRGIVENHPA
jgi:AraC-like DNA-binding protein